jgi:Amt family ammonium transporter
MSDSGDYVPLIPYNGTTATGGDAMTDDLNLYYNVRPAFLVLHTEPN